MRTHNIPSCSIKSKIYPYYDSRPGTMINTHYFELPLSQTYFHSSKGVRAIEVLLQFVLRREMTVHMATAGNVFCGDCFCIVFSPWLGSGIELCLFLKIFLLRDESFNIRA